MKRIKRITSATLFVVFVSLSWVTVEAINESAPAGGAISPPVTDGRRAASIAAPSATRTVQKIHIKVLNRENGKPVNGAKIDYQDSPMDGAALTDTNGQVTIYVHDGVLPEISVSHSHFINNRVRWDRFPNDSGPPPSEYTIRLDPATTIGGNVLDNAGKPIAGANVELWIDGTEIIEGEFHTEVAWVNRAVKTAADGTWTFDHVRAGAKSIKVAAWDYEHIDSPYFVLKDYVPVSALRDKTAILALPQAVEVSGRVFEPYFGNPVAGAKVAFGTDQNASNQIPALTTDKDGYFKFAAKPGMTLTLTATSAGYKPQIQQQLIEQKPVTLDFHLTPVQVQ